MWGYLSGFWLAPSVVFGGAVDLEYSRRFAAFRTSTLRDAFVLKPECSI